MGNKSKSTVFLLLILALSITVFAKPATAQSITKPAMPEFTVELAGPAFDIPPTYSFNASSGLFYVNEGYHFQYSTVNIVIENQPFTNQTNLDFLHYNVRIKPHNYPDSYWQELFSADADGYPIQTAGNYTIIPLPVEGTQAYGTLIGAGETTDIQVEAMIGHIGRNQTYPFEYIFFGEVSGWSSTQTVTVPPKTPFPVSPFSTPTNTPAPSQSAVPNSEITLPLTVFIVIVAVLSACIIALSVVLLQRARKEKLTSLYP